MKRKKVLLSVILMLCLSLSGCFAMEQEQNESENQDTTLTKIDANTTIQSIINDPVFDDYGRFIFPNDYREIEDTMTVSEIDSLLPYHNDIQTDTAIEVVNYLLNHANNGDTIFYDIYTEEEKQEDPSKEDTGLFFFKGNKDAPVAIISAGGGFSYVGSIHESFPHALELSKQGYNAFALQYRTGGAEVACKDLAAAIAFIYEHAEELEINPDGYSLWGGSAGARMAAYLGSYGTSAYGQQQYPRPSAIIMQYTGHSDFTENDPPTYACVGQDDGIADYRVMQERIDNLNNLGIDTEFHVYPSLGHGFGLGIGTSAEGWINDAIAFWQKHLN